MPTMTTVLATLCFTLMMLNPAVNDEQSKDAQPKEVDKETLMDPNSEQMTKTAPDTCNVTFDTTAGSFTIQLHRDWAPIGVDRFYNLAANGFFNDVRFFRVVPDFIIQFGIHADPEVSTAWRDARIKDDPSTQSNKKGTLTFATAGPGTRTTQMFINFKDNAFLDSQGFSPLGAVTEGMDIVEKLYAEYGERPDQGRLQQQGNAYLEAEFPKLDYIRSVTVEAVAAEAAE